MMGIWRRARKSWRYGKSEAGSSSAHPDQDCGRGDKGNVEEKGKGSKKREREREEREREREREKHGETYREGQSQEHCLKTPLLAWSQHRNPLASPQRPPKPGRRFINVPTLTQLCKRHKPVLHRLIDRPTLKAPARGQTAGRATSGLSAGPRPLDGQVIQFSGKRRAAD